MNIDIPPVCDAPLREAARLVKVLVREKAAGHRQWTENGCTCEVGVHVDWINVSTAVGNGLVEGLTDADVEIETPTDGTFGFVRDFAEGKWVLTRYEP